MTITSVRTRRFSIDEVVRHAYIEAGLWNIDQTLSPAKYTYGRDQLDRMTAQLAAQGLFARDVDFYDITLADAVREYAMPDYAFDVVGTAMYRTATATDPAISELQVTPMAQETYQLRVGKGVSGIPREYYVRRQTDQLLIWLWPIPGPAEVGAKVKFQVHTLRAGNAVGTATQDFEGYWVDYMVFALAARLAGSQGLAQRQSDMQILAREQLDLCKSYSNERPNGQMTLVHRTPWSR